MDNYKWLKNEKAPKIFVQAYKLIGTKEVLGTRNNPVILQWADDLGLEKQYNADEIPWCGLFMAYICLRAGKQIINNPLWARNWATYGSEQKIAMFGDVLVFVRNVGGHVGLYIGEDDKCYHVLAGNQGDEVCITRIQKNRCVAIRRTIWETGQPENVRVIKLAPTGSISENES